MNDDDGTEVEGISKLKKLDISADAARVLDGTCTDEGLDRVGKWLEAWYSSVSRAPNHESASGRGKVLSRLADKQHVHGALFELFLNHELRGRGAEVRIEPSVGGRTGDKTPDLLVDYQGSRYYVEALFLQEVHKSTGAEKDLVQKLDSHAINSDFRLLLSARSRLQTNIRRKRPPANSGMATRGRETGGRRGFRLADFRRGLSALREVRPCFRGSTGCRTEPWRRANR